MDFRFVCPLCKTQLTALRCPDCGSEFSASAGIPSFICRKMYATWSVLFVQQRLMRSMREGAWETGERKNPHTTTYTLSECRQLFSRFSIVNLEKTGEALKRLAILGRYVPKALDRPFHSLLGPCINIVAVKPGAADV